MFDYDFRPMFGCLFVAGALFGVMAVSIRIADGIEPFAVSKLLGDPAVYAVVLAGVGGFYLFTLRLVPLLPFFVINLLMGLTKMKAWTFYWVSQLGMLAGTLVYVNAGTQLGQVDSLRDVLSPGLLGSFVLLGVLPLVLKKFVDAEKARRV